MELHATRLCACQQQRNWLFPRADICRHGLASDHTHRLARHASWRWWYIWFDPHPLEAGKAILTQARRYSSYLFIFIFFRKGTIWLVIAFAAEIPRLVSLANLSSLTFCLYPVCIVGDYCVAFKWYFSLADLYMGSPTELDSVPNIRSVTHREFVAFNKGKYPLSHFFLTS